MGEIKENRLEMRELHRENSVIRQSGRTERGFLDGERAGWEGPEEIQALLFLQLLVIYKVPNRLSKCL